jgi:hypothetical protein
VLDPFLPELQDVFCDKEPTAAASAFEYNAVQAPSTRPRAHPVQLTEVEDVTAIAVYAASVQLSRT